MILTNRTDHLVFAQMVTGGKAYGEYEVMSYTPLDIWTEGLGVGE
jgi:hypothetical protein